MSDPELGRKLLDILARGYDSLTAGRTLLNQGLYADAVSRAYYAAFHAVVALLTAYGKSASSHAVVKATFHRDFVRTGLLNKDLGRSFERLSDDRQLGDYSYQANWSMERVVSDLDAADALLNSIETYLKQQGSLLADDEESH